jgi:signal transduction histidine kinase
MVFKVTVLHYTSGMSVDKHKLKTPLTAIFGYAQLLANSKNLTPKQKEWAGELIKESKRLLAMIEELTP